MFREFSTQWNPPRRVHTVENSGEEAMDDMKWAWVLFVAA